MAARRFLTVEQGVEQLLKATPSLHFDGTTKTEWQEWRRKFRRNLVKTWVRRQKRYRWKLKPWSRHNTMVIRGKKLSLIRIRFLRFQRTS